MTEHWRYHNYIITYNSRLEQLCATNNIKLPNKPSYLLERTKLFTDKLLSYPMKWIKYNSDKQVKVDCILDKRGNSDHTDIRYLIQWKYFPTALNSWEPANYINAEHMIHRYELLHCIANNKITQLNNDIIRNGLLSDRDLPQSEPSSDNDDDDSNNDIIDLTSIKSESPVNIDVLYRTNTNNRKHIMQSTAAAATVPPLTHAEELINESRSEQSSQLSNKHSGPK